MRGRCCVPFCNNSNSDGVSFFRLPVEENRRTAWIAKIGRIAGVRKNPRVCSIHFEVCYFKNMQRNRIENTAIPTLFLEDYYKGKMVEEEQSDPLEITKDPEILKSAQSELSKVDVLVCGECHEVFHFIEQFQEHKNGDNCTKKSVLKEGLQNDSKSQIWGFMLWKNAKFKSSVPEETPPSSWNVYQLWCNLDQTQKDSWIAAGKSLQSIYSITTNKLSTSTPLNKQGKIKLLNKKPDDDEELEESETKNSRLENDPLADIESDLDLEEELAKHKLLKEKCENGGIKKTILKPVELNSDVTILPSSKGVKKAIRTHEGEKKGEFAVEKIVSKRYNPGKKTHEYLIKWENFPEEQNSWEPVAHLESCKQLVEDFDRHLQKLKAQKISRGSLVQRRPHKKLLPERNSDLILTSTGPGRPQRTSKQKALNQVKVWCGNISDADEGGSGKRVFSDSDSDSFEKKMKLEEESTDSEEDVRPPITVRKVIKTPLNGIGRKQPLPENILVPDAHGVVTINQKQLPALSSGVYVMSKTAGIIKLDSNTSKIAASGGHAVIKVAPKIGQTSIKVVKKDSTNGSKPTILNSKFKPMMKPIGAKVIAHRRAPSATIIKKTEPLKIEMKMDDDESDGLEELPFPTDLPLPGPESPPGEFTLCPLTGKILGQDYSEEEQTVSIKEEVTDTHTAANEYNSLDVLSDLTACNILNEPSTIKVEAEAQESAIKEKDMPEGSVSTLVEGKSIEQKISRSIKEEDIDKTQSIEAALSAMEGDDTSILVTTTSGSSTSSILSTALSNANIEPSAPSITTTTTLLKKVDVPDTIRQKTAMNRHIINRTIIPKPAPQAIITRITPSSVNKTKQMMNKQKLGAPPPTTFRKAIRQTYSNRSPNVIRKIGSTTVYHNTSTPTSLVSTDTTSLATTLSTSISTESLVETLSSSTPPEVINMPLLTDLETPSTSAEMNSEPETPQTSLPAAEETMTTDLNTISLNESEAPLLITGEDGTIYQVAGQNEDGQTILIAQDADGQQQCLLVASESATELTEPATVNAAIVSEAQEQLEEPIVMNTEPESDNAEDSQIVAQIVSAQPPSPGGTRKVVLMLPDGNLMMTEVTAEQYAALELDK